ncbi:MAG: hypothetical protein JWN86_3464 [Planctomycetota bacterium]|nr:hypothetical protein [Planctomycetota bacterium]
METLKTITPHLAVAGQPTESDLKTLRDQGYVGVINLRNDGEPEQPITTKEEGELAKKLGLEYLHYGVGGAPFSRDGVEAVYDFLDRHPSEKVLVHCRSGGRAQAILLLFEARKRGWSASDAITNGRGMGLDVKGGLAAMVEQYLAANPHT